MTPGDPQKFFYRLLTLSTDFQRSSWGGENFSPPQELVVTKSAAFCWRGFQDLLTKVWT